MLSFIFQIASYFMTNLCLVVITTQFQETKQRENELLRESRRREGTSTSTIASSRYGKDGCWVEILRYVEHLIRRFKRRLYRRFNWKYCDTGSKRKKGSKHRKRRRRKKKLVYHHHHHHHHHHHYHHHVHCTDPDCPCSKVAPQFPVHPGSADVTPNTSTVDIQPIQSKHFQPSANTLTVPGQVPGNGTSGRENDNGKGTIPTISIITGSSCSVRKEPSSSTHGGEMITTATAAVAINGKSAVADMATHTFLSAASLSSAAATATASAAAASVIHNVCSCAVEHVEEDIKVDYESECVYEEDGGSESEFTDDEVDEEEDGKDTACSRLRQVCRRSVDSKWFMYIIMAAIFLNTLSMGIEYHGQVIKLFLISDNIRRNGGKDFVSSAPWRWIVLANHSCTGQSTRLKSTFHLCVIKSVKSFSFFLAFKDDRGAWNFELHLHGHIWYWNGAKVDRHGSLWLHQRSFQHIWRVYRYHEVSSIIC